MAKDFDKTPSYFNNEEVFERYLGMTSYYLTLQSCVEKLIGIINPESVVELGSATGATSIRLAEKFKDTHFVGIDMREDVVNIAKKLGCKIDNLEFIIEDMNEYAKRQVDEDFVLMLYSFHHIVDPIENKIIFLNNIYNNMKKGAYLCIAETFIPDRAHGVGDCKSILNLWETRKQEGFASTFWNALESVDEAGISEAIKIGEYCGDNELLAGTLVAKRDDEYLVQPSYLIDIGKKAGFKVILNQPVNTLEDRIILFRK